MAKCPTCGRAKHRTLPQNSLAATWYLEIANTLKEDDALGWKCFCKLHFGVPILRAEEPSFKLAYDATIKGMTYEQKLKVMRLLPVTSLMNTDQLSKYLDAVKDHFFGKVDLRFPMEG